MPSFVTLGKIPRLPAFCIMLNSFCNTFAYILVYAIFALYFKQVHHRADATWFWRCGPRFFVIRFNELDPGKFGRTDADGWRCRRRVESAAGSLPVSFHSQFGLWKILALLGFKALHPERHIVHMDLFQPGYDDPVVACNHCRASPGGGHLCLLGLNQRRRNSSTMSGFHCGPWMGWKVQKVMCKLRLRSTAASGQWT